MADKNIGDLKGARAARAVISGQYSESKYLNIMKITHTLIKNGAMSKGEIASAINVSQSTVFSSVSELVKRKLVYYTRPESLRRDNSKGRHSSLIDIDQSSCFTMGIVVNRKTITAAISTLRLGILERTSSNLYSTKPEDILAQISAAIKQLLLNNCLEEKKIVGCTIAIVSPFWEPLGIEIVSKLPYSEKVERYFGERYSFPVFLQTLAGAGGLYAYEQLSRNYENTVLNYYDLDDMLYFSTISFNTAAKTVIPETSYLGNLVIAGGPSPAPPHSLLIIPIKTRFSYNSIFNEVIKNLGGPDKQRWLEMKDELRTSEQRLNFYLDEAKHGNVELMTAIAMRICQAAITFYNHSEYEGAEKIILSGVPGGNTGKSFIKKTIEERLDEKTLKKFVFSDDSETSILLGACANSVKEGFFDYFLSIQ